MKNHSRTRGSLRLATKLALMLLPALALPVNAQVSPQLGITNSSAGVSVFWPLADSGFALLWTSSPAVSNSWQLYPTPPVELGQKYIVPVSATNALAFFRLIATAAPTVATHPASAISGDSAVMNSSINPNYDVTTSAYFEYGTTTNYGASTIQTGIGAASQTFDITLANLSPLTTYHYRIDAINAKGTNSGADASFTTGAIQPGQASPTVQTIAASFVSTNIFLQATVNDNASVTNVFAYFQYGTSTNYGSVTAGGHFASRTQTLLIGVSVNGLAPATTYHYRVVAFNDGGTSIGGDVSFDSATSK